MVSWNAQSMSMFTPQKIREQTLQPQQVIAVNGNISMAVFENYDHRRFKDEGKVGQGSYGTVFKAWDTKE